MSGDIFVISGLREQRSAVAGRIVDMRREIDTLQADLLHLAGRSLADQTLVAAL